MESIKGNVMKYLLLSILIAVTACSKQDAGGPQNQNEGATIGNGVYLKMMADLTDAESLTSNIAQGKEGKRLFKLTFGKKLAAVLSGEHQLISFKLTPTHIIARVDIVEDKERCTLVAIPKVKGISKVMCLNRDLMACDETAFENRAGYDVRGSEVFFTHQENPIKPGIGQYPDYQQCYTYATKGDSRSAKSELRRWDGFSEKVETLFHTEPQTTKNSQLFVRDVFASETNLNLCLDAIHSGEESLYCKADGETEWKKVRGLSNHSTYGTPYLKLGNSVLAEKYRPRNEGGRLDLNTLEITERKGSLPKKIDFLLENGGRLGSDDQGTITIVKPDGNSEQAFIVDLPSATPARVGNYAWYAGRESLQRIDLRNGEVEHRDHFHATKLLNLTSISWVLGDFLQVDGTAPQGFDGTTFLDAKGELVSAQVKSVPLEHPITLQWNQ